MRVQMPVEYNLFIELSEKLVDETRIVSILDQILNKLERVHIRAMLLIVLTISDCDTSTSERGNSGGHFVVDFESVEKQASHQQAKTHGQVKAGDE